jgi:hypothetical protein
MAGRQARNRLKEEEEDSCRPVASTGEWSSLSLGSWSPEPAPLASLGVHGRAVAVEPGHAGWSWDTQLPPSASDAQWTLAS